MGALEDVAERGLREAADAGGEAAEQGFKRSADAAGEGAGQGFRRSAEALDDVSPGARSPELADGYAPPCRFRCFAAGTLIATAEGLAPIETVQVGDQVYAYDETTGEEHLSEVVALHHRDVEALWVLEVGGERIETTDEHPFYVAGQGWTEAKDLQAGDILIASGGDRLPLRSVEVVQQPARVYNLEVRDLHSYLVGRVGAWCITAFRLQRQKSRLR